MASLNYHNYGAITIINVNICDAMNIHLEQCCFHYGIIMIFIELPYMGIICNTNNVLLKMLAVIIFGGIDRNCFLNI